MKKFYFFVKTIGTKKVFMFLVMMFCLFVNNVNAQIAVNVTNNTNTTPNLAASYTSLANALTDLNAVNAMSGPITLTLAAGTETTPATGLLLGSATLNPVLNATNTITIIGAGSATILNAGVGTATPASAVPDGILKLVGVDYVTIDGVTFTDTNATNPASMEVGLGMFKLSATDGCNNNTIQNCIFNMQRVNNVTGTAPMVEGSVGIAMMNSTALTSTTVVTVTAASGASSNNRFYSNTINGGNYGIVLRGFAATSPFTLADTNNDIGGLSLATGNTILNYGGAAAATNPAAGIRIVDQWSANAAFNTINNNNGSGVNHVSTLRGIITSGGTSASLNINNNAITLFGGGTTSQLDGISNAAGSTAAGNSININNNTLVLNYASATGATINGIVNSSSAATVNINNNNISAGSVIPGTGTHILISGGSPTNLNISGNTINNFSRSSATTGTLRGIVITNPTTTVINNNTISNLSYTNAASTGTIEGVYGLSSSIDVTISNNSVNGLTAAGGIITGIREFGVAGNKNIFGNTIYNFSNTAGYAGTGVNYFGIHCSTGVTNIYRNKVYGLTSLGTTGANAAGIFVTGGTTSTIYNNIIGQLYTPTATGLNAVRGIDISGGTTVNVYNNTVRLDATSTSVTTFGTSCFMFNTTPTTVDVKNNIFANASTPAQEGANVATNGISAGIRRSAGTAAVVPANYATTSNNNLIWVNPTAGTNNHASYAEGLATLTNVQNTVANLKTFMVNRDQLSVEENPTFVSTTGSNATFLHIDTVAPTGIESGGTAIGSVTTDFDNNIRQGNIGYIGTGSAPDIGADEFEGVSSTPVCTGTPAVANSLTSNNNFCAGASTSLTLDVSYTTLNNTYQWESSLDNVTYNPIGGANSASYNAFPLVSTWYRCVVTCTASGFSSTSTPVQVTINAAVYATIPLSESFETTWTTSCVVAPLGQDTPNNSWRMTRGAADADASWRADNTTTTLSGWAGTGGAYSPISQDGLRSARFHSFNTSPAGTQGTLDLYVDLSTPGVKQLSYWYIAPSTGVDQLDVLLSEDGGVTFNPITTVPAIAPPTTAVTVWTNITASIASVSATSIIRFRGTGDNGSFDIGLDNVSITLPCSGTPTAGTITSPGSVCSATPFNLSLTGNTSGIGITYQWQSSPDGIAPYADIVGQTSSVMTLSQTASTFYQCVITCTNGGASATTIPVQVNMNTVFACYCASTYTNGTGATGADAITNVTLGTLNNSSNGGATATPSPYYTFYNAVTVPNLTQGSGQTISISFGTDGAQFSGVWIDYNQDGDLIDAGEFVANSTVTAGASGTSILNFTVPVGATLGNTLMRVRGANDSVLTNTPCGASSSTWGETEDYIVNITPCIAPSISTQPLTQSVCENANVTFSVTAAGTGLTYQWKKEGVDIPTATSASYTITGALVAATGNYTVLVTGACGTLLSDVAVLTVTANSSLPTEVVSACDTYTWAANGAVYTTSGIYTNTVNCVTSTLDLTINTTPVADAPANVTACDSYTLPALTVGNYFTGAGGTGTALSAGNSITSSQTIYVYAQTGTTPNCTDENSFSVTINNSPVADAPANVTACDSYTLPALTVGNYFTGAGGTGTALSAGNIVTSSQTIYVYAETGTTPNCTDENSFSVTINTTPVADAPANVTACDSYTLPALTVGNYFTGAGGTGIALSAGNTITSSQTIYVYAETGTTPNCTDENSFAVTINTTPVADAPANVTACDSYTLPVLTVGNYFTGAGGTGTALSAGNSITSTQTIYVYAQTGTIPNCTDENSFSVTINNSPVADAPANVSVCDSYTLPALTVGNYFTGAGGTGTALSAGNSITSTQTIYVYAETGTTPNCTDENSFTVTITTATISGATTQVINGGVAADATIEDIVVTSNGTVTWFASSSDAISNINPLPVGTQLVDGNVYYGVTNIGSCRSADLGVTVTVVLGTSSFDLSQLNYYPNPVNDIFNVKYNKEIISVDVYDLTGRKVMDMKPNTLDVQLNMTNLSSAMYIVRLQSVDGTTDLKVYKN